MKTLLLFSIKIYKNTWWCSGCCNERYQAAKGVAQDEERDAIGPVQPLPGPAVRHHGKGKVLLQGGRELRPLAGGAPVAQVVVAERQVAAAGKVGADDVKVAPQVGAVAVGYVQQGPE